MGNDMMINGNDKCDAMIHQKQRLYMELDLQSLFGLHVQWCTAVLIGWDPATPPPPPYLGSYTRALLVSQDRWHFFVAPWLEVMHDRMSWNDKCDAMIHQNSEGKHEMMSGNDKCDAMIHQKTRMTWWSEMINAMTWFIRSYALHDERKRQMRCHDSSEGMYAMIKKRIKLYYILFHQNGMVKYENINHTIFKTASIRLLYLKF